jgi:acyl carrier protein
MSIATSFRSIDREAIHQGVIGILKNMTSDWDMDFEGEIQRETRLISDLGFESIDVVQLIVAVEEHFQRRDLPFAELVMEDGRYVEELHVGNIVDFLVTYLPSN